MMTSSWHHPGSCRKKFFLDLEKFRMGWKNRDVRTGICCVYGILVFTHIAIIFYLSSALVPLGKAPFLSQIGTKTSNSGTARQTDVSQCVTVATSHVGPSLGPPELVWWCRLHSIASPGSGEWDGESFRHLQLYVHGQPFLGWLLAVNWFTSG